VYRADDLKLGQPVALKFLPRSLAQDPALLERFHAEVRNARQVSHPSVCRVYDIGEIEGHPFLTMEYIDGEDLATLLRRIGRLPSDKALEIARQLCAGLAAAHDKGVVHRALKPANVMIDGRGRARITDFGLAVRSDEAGGEIAGTPAYMSPEQLQGQPATTRSDVYSLGLLFYELYTGKRPFDAADFSGWLRKHAEEQPSAPSHHTSDIDPAVERAILRCLEKDPRQRPSSVLQVAAALPGGDPLAAALAAGETPSPEMVAAAQPEAAISVRAAVLLVVAICAVMAASAPLARRGTLLGIAPMTRSPDALADRAREITQQLGYVDTPADSAWWLDAQGEYLRYRARQENSTWFRDLPSSWPRPHRFYYRQSPNSLEPLDPIHRVTLEDPPLTTPGMVFVALDSAGQLLTFQVVPPKFEPNNAAPAAKVDWAAVFRAAGLEIGNFQNAPVLLVPSSVFDERGAWNGTVNGVPIHVEAAAFHGKLVDFEVAGPWAQTPQPPAGKSGQIILAIFILLVFGVGSLLSLFLARRNLRQGRGDRQGAFRVSLFVALVSFVDLLLSAHVPYIGAYLAEGPFTIGAPLYAGGVTWLSYLALEPLVRRQSPHLLIGWTRLLSGRFADPLVGRDILVGILAAAVVRIIRVAGAAVPWWISLPGATPLGLPYGVLRPLSLPQGLMNGIWLTVVFTMAFLFLAALCRLVFRTRWVGLALVLMLVWMVGLTPDLSLSGRALAISVCAGVLAGAIFAGIMEGFGPLAFAVTLLLSTRVFGSATFDFRTGTWYFGHTLVVIVLLAGLVLFAFHSALAGRSLFGKLLEET
ncbi:MAG: protein kinase, partial [Acidobacteriota bacterium]|nr:protein kinase [Acidobacteriota bacterium]